MITDDYLAMEPELQNNFDSLYVKTKSVSNIESRAASSVKMNVEPPKKASEI